MNNLNVLLALLFSAFFSMQNSHLEAGDSFCWKKTVARGVGKLKTTCDTGKELIGGYCYDKCEAGQKRIGYECHTSCPSEWVDDGLYCRKPEYGRGVGYPWKFEHIFRSFPWVLTFDLKGALADCQTAKGVNQCELSGAIYYPKCKEGYKSVGCCVCQPIVDQNTCNSFGLGKNLGSSCQKYFERWPKDAYCPEGDHEDAGLCYPPCSDGYLGVGPICWQTTAPDSGWVECGLGYARNEASCRRVMAEQIFAGAGLALNLASMGASHVSIDVSSELLDVSELILNCIEDGGVYSQASGSIINSASQNVFPNATKFILGTKELVSTFKDNGSSPLDLIHTAGDWVSLFDPTGLSGLVSSYAYPVCDEADTSHNPQDDLIPFPIWQNGEPSNNIGEENCVAMIEKGILKNHSCSETYKFACRKKNDNLVWKISSDAGGWEDFSDKCPSDYEFSAPRTHFENDKLAEVLGEETVWVRRYDVNFDGNYVIPPYSNWVQGMTSVYHPTKNCVRMRRDGQWEIADCSGSHKFACQNSLNEWKLSDNSKSWDLFNSAPCPNDFVFAAPRTSEENSNLMSALASDGSQHVWLPITDRASKDGEFVVSPLKMNWVPKSSSASGVTLDSYDCLKVWDSGDWSEEKCWEQQHRFACQNLSDLKDWVVSDSEAYYFEYEMKNICPDGYEFSTPNTEVESNVLRTKMAMANVSQVWISLNDQEEEGVYRDLRFYYYYIPSFFGSEGVSSSAVKICKDENLGGVNSTINGSSVGLSTSLNDQVSSLEVFAGYTVTLYENKNYQGNNVTIGPGKYMNMNQAGFSDNSLSSFKVNNVAVIIYEDHQFKNTSQSFSEGSWDIQNLDKTDSASSIKVREGYQVTLYEQEGFTGSSVTLGPGVYPDLGKAEFIDNGLSSLKVSKLP